MVALDDLLKDIRWLIDNTNRVEDTTGFKHGLLTVCIEWWDRLQWRDEGYTCSYVYDEPYESGHYILDATFGHSLQLPDAVHQSVEATKELLGDKA